MFDTISFFILAYCHISEGQLTIAVSIYLMLSQCFRKMRRLSPQQETTPTKKDRHSGGPVSLEINIYKCFGITKTHEDIQSNQASSTMTFYTVCQ